MLVRMMHCFTCLLGSQGSFHTDLIANMFSFFSVSSDVPLTVRAEAVVRQANDCVALSRRSRILCTVGKTPYGDLEVDLSMSCYPQLVVGIGYDAQADTQSFEFCVDDLRDVLRLGGVFSVLARDMSVVQHYGTFLAVYEFFALTQSRRSTVRLDKRSFVSLLEQAREKGETDADILKVTVRKKADEYRFLTDGKGGRPVE